MLDTRVRVVIAYSAIFFKYLFYLIFEEFEFQFPPSDQHL